MASKKSPQQAPPTPDPTPDDVRAMLMVQALDAYAGWLNGFMTLGLDQAMVGSKLIAEIAEIRGQHFAQASTRITELLVVHTKLSTLWFERQNVLIKSGSSPPQGRSADYDRLVERQKNTIAELRAACGLPPLK